ncbi:CPBP family intramembrane glutamic endopeptidase [Parafilimonas terrae]|jgi:membrane protease YdiL (CAAX protease family)|uniref:CAAX protease self-immunity n=1 Tax=Parafilimonas terrae TaxID=1465490 RepID=A0A1I5USW7_9BACT|nr:type II CAAX endopeptidase family protein [Parafilimonas terrae]SFP98365.1 CAAX protease self-immunity [Parafilimonas terrae]
MDKVNYLKTVTSILVIALLILFPHFAHLPFASYVVVCFLIIIIYLKTQYKTLGYIGLKRKGLSVHTFIVGVLSAILWMAFVKFIYLPFINHFFQDYIKAYTDYDFVKNNLSGLLIATIVAWIAGGFYEEIAFRGFIQNIIQTWFSKYNFSFWHAGLFTSILFGVYHWQQGIFGIIGATLGGLYWLYLFKKYNKNLWYPIISHAVYDTIALTMIYFDVLNN